MHAPLETMVLDSGPSTRATLAGSRRSKSNGSLSSLGPSTPDPDETYTVLIALPQSCPSDSHRFPMEAPMAAGMGTQRLQPKAPSTDPACRPLVTEAERLVALRR